MAYRPPEQSLVGQIIDVFVLLVLTVGSLFVPLYLGLAGATKTPNPSPNPTWESLGQNAIEQQQWAALIIMTVLVIGFFVLVVRLGTCSILWPRCRGIPGSTRSPSSF